MANRLVCKQIYRIREIVLSVDGENNNKKFYSTYWSIVSIDKKLVSYNILGNNRQFIQI